MAALLPLTGGRAAIVMSWPHPGMTWSHPERESPRRLGNGRLVRRAAPLALAEKMIRHPREVPSHGSDRPG